MLSRVLPPHEDPLKRSGFSVDANAPFSINPHARGGGGLRGAGGTTMARFLVKRARGVVASTGGATNGEGDVKSWYFWWLAPEVQVLIFNGRERIGVPNSLISFV